MLDLNKFSSENLAKIQIILKVVLESYEFNPSNEENFFVSVKKLKNLGLDFDETIKIFQKIEKEENGALKYRGFENLKKYIDRDTAYSTLVSAYKREHPLAIKDHKRIKQLYSEALKKLEFKQIANLPSVTIPKNIIEDLNITVGWHKSQLEEASKQISSCLHNKNKDNFLENITKTIEQATKPIKSTLEAFDSSKRILSITDKNYISTAIKQLTGPLKQLNNVVKSNDSRKIIYSNEHRPTKEIKHTENQQKISLADKEILKKREKKYDQMMLNFDKLLTRHEKLLLLLENNASKTSNKTDVIKKNLITRDGSNGNFYYNNNLIKFGGKQTIYYLILECLYEKSDIDGFCSYESINEYLEKHNQKIYVASIQIRNRIKNGVTNLFRFSGLINEAPDGNALIQKVKGKGITIYNPPIR